MNITYNLNSITADDSYQSMVFTREDGLTHVDSFLLPKDQFGAIDQTELAILVEAQYQYVLAKQDAIDWQ